METTTIPRAAIHPDVEQLRVVRQAIENLIDFDIVVDDCRRDVNRALDRLREAVDTRGRAIAMLESIVRDVPAPAA